ncbi:MAG: hypothetical protein J2P31_05585 [Blastocatellia bacterium]|nr:hypothetical protein [Blastocatellia bacterium]
MNNILLFRSAIRGRQFAAFPIPAVLVIIRRLKDCIGSPQSFRFPDRIGFCGVPFQRVGIFIYEAKMAKRDKNNKNFFFCSFCSFLPLLLHIKRAVI